jgi:hypothetical protein
MHTKRPYRFKRQKVGQHGSANLFVGPGIEAKPVIGAEDLNTAYRAGYAAAIEVFADAILEVVGGRSAKKA